MRRGMAQPARWHRGKMVCFSAVTLSYNYKLALVRRWRSEKSAHQAGVRVCVRKMCLKDGPANTPCASSSLNERHRPVRCATKQRNGHTRGVGQEVRLTKHAHERSYEFIRRTNPLLIGRRSRARTSHILLRDLGRPSHRYVPSQRHLRRRPLPRADRGARRAAAASRCAEAGRGHPV